MTKKRLSDLLRQEAQNLEEGGSPTNPTPETSDAKTSAASRSAKTTNRRRSPKSTQTAPADTATGDSSAPPAESVEPSADQTNQHTKLVTELEGAIADLRAALATARRTEDTLREEITHLESALQQQQDLVQTLKTEIEQGDRYKAELEQTKQVILTLSDNNLKIQEELNTLKQKPAPSNHGSVNLELRRILEHPTQKGQPSTSFSDAEIGWVD